MNTSTENVNSKQRFVVPTKMLKAEILRHALKLATEANYAGADGSKSHMGRDYEYKAGKNHEKSSSTTRLENSGWKRLLAERVHAYMPHVSANAPVRRLYAILVEEHPTTHVTIADAFLLACGVQIEDTDIPTLPWTLLSANEWIDMHCEDYGRDIDPELRKAAAKAILRRSEKIVGASSLGRKGLAQYKNRSGIAAIGKAARAAA
jgi:hypothetical protein